MATTLNEIIKMMNGLEPIINAEQAHINKQQTVSDEYLKQAKIHLDRWDCLKQAKNLIESNHCFDPLSAIPRVKAEDFDNDAEKKSYIDGKFRSIFATYVPYRILIKHGFFIYTGQVKVYLCKIVREESGLELSFMEEFENIPDAVNRLKQIYIDFIIKD